jgi:hypothetical protein
MILNDNSSATPVENTHHGGFLSGSKFSIQYPVSAYTKWS